MIAFVFVLFFTIKKIHTISRHIKNKKNARDEKAERAVNSRRAFLPCSSSLSRPRLGARASFCDAIIKNREREREGVFCEDEAKRKKNVIFRGPDFVKTPTKQGVKKKIISNKFVCVCVRAFLHYLLSRFHKIDDAEFTINQWQSERTVVSR